MIPFKIITDSAVVQKLYDIILAFPPYITLRSNKIKRGSCVRDSKKVLDDLNFLKNGKLVQHGPPLITCLLRRDVFELGLNV
jgi:hypothetical protein